MNFLKDNPKIHDDIYITFQMRRHFVEYQDHSKSNFSIQQKQSFKIVSKYRCF